MSYLSDLQTRRDSIAAELAALTSTKAGGKPNNDTGGEGAEIDHVGYKDGLYRELREINDLIAAIGASEDAWEINAEAIV